MAFVIVPNELRDAINSRLDTAYKECPDAEIDRDIHYHELLRLYDENGRIPEFTLAKRETA